MVRRVLPSSWRQKALREELPTSPWLLLLGMVSLCISAWFLGWVRGLREFGVFAAIPVGTVLFCCQCVVSWLLGVGPLRTAGSWKDLRCWLVLALALAGPLLTVLTLVLVV